MKISSISIASSSWSKVGMKFPKISTPLSSASRLTLRNMWNLHSPLIIRNWFLNGCTRYQPITSIRIRNRRSGTCWKFMSHLQGKFLSVSIGIPFLQVEAGINFQSFQISTQFWLSTLNLISLLSVFKSMMILWTLYLVLLTMAITSKKGIRWKIKYQFMKTIRKMGKSKHSIWKTVCWPHAFYTRIKSMSLRRSWKLNCPAEDIVRIRMESAFQSSIKSQISLSQRSKDMEFFVRLWSSWKTK